MDEKCRKCRKNTFPRSDRYGWVMMFIDLVPIWKQFRTIFETSVLILEKHTPDKIHESETGRPCFSYPIIGMQMHATNTKMSTMYPTFVSVIAEFTDKLNLTYLYIYIYYYFFGCFVEVIEETNLGLHRQMQRVEIPGSKVVSASILGVSRL
jgi:hypothetical protein